MKITRTHSRLLPLLFCLLLPACSTASPQPPQGDSPTQIPPQSTTAPTASIQPTSEPEPAVEIVKIEEPSLLHLWALSGSIDAAGLMNVATGAPEDDKGCGTRDFTSYNGAGGEAVLALKYAPSITPVQANLWLTNETNEILRVEVMNTTSGLGREIFTAGDSFDETILEDNDCERILNIPIEVDFEVDALFVTFSSLSAAAGVDAVELAGTSNLFVDAPVYWRMPLPAAPVSVVVDQYNQVIIAVEDNSIIKFDVEGNFLSDMPPLTDSAISDVTIDRDNNLVFSDLYFGTYSILYPDGEKLVGGGDAPTIDVAIQPDNGKLFMLDDMGGVVYLVPYFPGTDEIINPLPLEDIAYTGLAFSPDNRLFSIRPNGGFLAELDPITGLEVFSIPLKSAEYIDAAPVEFTIDGAGNFYVLFERNDGNSAVAVFDPDGALIRRLGTLTEPVNGDWPLGSYHKPVSIAVTADGRFAFIVDGDGVTNYLTCLMMRED